MIYETLIVVVTLRRGSYESYLMNEGLITTFVTKKIDRSLKPLPMSFLDVRQPGDIASVSATVDSKTVGPLIFFVLQCKNIFTLRK